MRKHLTSEDIKKMSSMTADEVSLFMKNNYPISDEEKAEYEAIRNKLTYYKIHDLNLIGKKDQGIPYVYKTGEWNVDDDNIVTDRLMGYDGDSIGSSTIFDIDEITEQEAMEFIQNQDGQ